MNWRKSDLSSLWFGSKEVGLGIHLGSEYGRLLARLFLYLTFTVIP